MDISLVSALIRFVQMALQNKLKLGKKLINKYVVIEGRRYLIFRHAYIKEDYDKKSAAVLAIRFQFPNNSLKRDRIASYFQIPVFVGIPGFQAKLWTYDEENDTFQGVYQWKSAKHVKDYLNSYAVRYVKSKTKKDSVNYNIYENTDLTDFIKDKIKYNTF